VTGHLSPQQIEDYRGQRLAPAALLDVDDHLAACAACRTHVEAALHGTAASLYADFAEAAPAPHLLFEQIAGYVDETLALAERQLVADHLAACAQCAYEAEDLRAFKPEAAAQPERPEVAQVGAAGWWSKLRARLWPQTTVPAFGWALAALLVIVLAGWLIRLALKEQPAAPQFAGGGQQTPVSPQLPPSPVPSPPLTPQAAPLLAQLNDGDRQITLDRQGKLGGLDDLSPAYQQMVKEALRTERLVQPGSLAGLNRRGSSLMGADEQGNQFSLSAPVSKVVLSDRPTFRWTQLAGASGYVVEIYDEQFSLVAKSQTLPDTQWAPAQPLPRGGVYAWQVKASKDGQEVQAPKPPAPQARFRVLQQAQAAEILRARRSPTPSHLTLGLLYAQAGLLDEAEQELRALRKANPDSATVRRLLAQVQALRR
jgi:hypothetical protein